MLASPTLTAEEFKQVHNALCRLDSVAARLEVSIKTELHEQLIAAVETIRAQFSTAYEQDDAIFAARGAHYEEIGKLNGIKHSSWSMHHVTDMLAQHPWAGADRVVYRDHWGEVSVSVSVSGNTWAALWRAADECIRLSEDSHHIFVENFKVDRNDPRTLVLSTGS